MRSAITMAVFLALASGMTSCASDEKAIPPAVAGDSIAAAALPSPVSCLVDSSGIGGIRLGMTLDEARKALPLANFARDSDGDGAALVAVKMDTVDLMIVSANEDDADAPVDWTKTVQSIETFAPTCGTADGIHPGSLVTDVERLLGKTTRIVESEIESRQYITFDRVPAGLTFRLDYTGVFPENRRETTRFDPKARIFSIAVSR